MATVRVSGPRVGDRLPRLPDPRLPRDRLVERVGALPPGGVALLVAPSGYGLTTLLGMVARATADPVVWVSPRRGADPVVSFCTRLRDGLAACGVPLPEAPALAGSDLAGWRRHVAQVIGLAADGPRVLVVIDDLAQDPALEAVMQEVVDDLPDTVRLIARAREMPRLDLARPLGSGRLLLLGRSELALSREESEEFLQLVAPGIPAGSVRALAAVADGWVAALRAGASAVDASGTDPAGWLLGPGLEILFGPGLGRLDPADRDLLVTCSVLDRLDVQVCDAVVGRSDSAERLARLAARLLIDRAAGPGPVYEVPPLFHEFLRRKLAERGRGAQARAHEVAGRRLAQLGDVEASISHLLDCGQVAMAREVLSSHVGLLLDTGRSERVRSWYRRAPELAVPDDQLHLLGAAWSELLSGDVPGAGRHLAELEAVASQGGPIAAPGDVPTALGAEWLRVEALFLRTVLEAWTGHTSRAAQRLAGVRALFGDSWSRMSQQSSAFLQVRVDLWSGDLISARERLAPLSGRAGTLQFFRQVAIPSLGAWLAAEEGRAHRACFLADSALESLVATGRIGPVDDCDARLARSRALADLGESTAAHEEAARVEETARVVGHVPYLVLAALAHARALAAGGQWHGAEEQLASARLVLRRHGVAGPLERRIAVVEVDLAIEAGDRARARSLVQRLAEDRDREVLMVRLLAMGGALRESEVVAQVRRARPESPREVVDARMVMAALTAPARRQEAVMHLRAAAAVAHDNGMLRALCGRAEEVRILAEQVAGEGADPAVSALLPVQRTPEEADARPVAPLSRGERELLDGLARTQGNRELAAELGISTNTLKTRLRRLYAKLGVHDRDSALRATGSGHRSG